MALSLRVLTDDRESTLLAENAALRAQLTDVLRQLDWFKRQLFGRKSEKRIDNALADADRLLIRELFLVGGSSFNALKESLEESRRIELKLEFLDLGEERLTPRDAPLDDAPCPLDL